MEGPARRDHQGRQIQEPVPGLTRRRLHHRDWLYPSDLKSSGLGEAACLARRLPRPKPSARPPWKQQSRRCRVRRGRRCAPCASAWREIAFRCSACCRSRRSSQSSHLSFQGYFAAKAICTGKYRLPEGSPPPCQWSAFWANAVRLGGEMGAAFGEGSMQAGLDWT